VEGKETKFGVGACVTRTSGLTSKPFLFYTILFSCQGLLGLPILDLRVIFRFLMMGYERKWDLALSLIGVCGIACETSAKPAAAPHLQRAASH